MSLQRQGILRNSHKLCPFTANTDSSAGIGLVTRLRAGRLRILAPCSTSTRNFLILKKKKIHIDSGSLPVPCSMRSWGTFPFFYSSRSVKLTHHLPTVPSSRMQGSVPRFFRMTSWCPQGLHLHLTLVPCLIHICNYVRTVHGSGDFSC